MANYDAAINVVIRNERSLARVITRIEQVSELLNRINATKVNIFGKSSGLGGDIAAKQLKDLQDNIRNVVNASDDAAQRAKLLGNTFASTAQSAGIYATVLQNVSLKSGGLKNQTGEVRNLATAWGIAAQQADTYASRLDQIQNDVSRKLQGLQPQEERDIEVERRKQFVNDTKRKRAQAQAVQETVDALKSQRVQESAIAETLAEQNTELNKRVRLRASIIEKIEKGRSIRIARERSAFLQGNPQAYERPAGPGGAFRFPQADAIEAAAREQKNFNALQEEARKKAKGNLELQYNWAKALGQREEIAKELRTVAANDLQDQKEAAKVEERRLRLERRRKDVLRARQKAQRTQRAVGEGIIGGAFPLLFGQGVGASVGGGLGGVAGGLMGGQLGFGLALVGTAVGTAVDTFVKNMGDLANSLGDPAKALEALEKAGLKVDASVKAQVESLLKAGKAYEAQQLIFEQINNTLGPAAVGQLNAYQQESEKLNSVYQEISGSIQREMLPALVGLLSIINTIVKVAKDLDLGGAIKKGAVTNLAVSNPPLLAGGFALQQIGIEAGKRAGENVPLSPELQQIEEERALKNKDLEDSLRRQVELSKRRLDAAKINKKTDLDAWLVAQQQIIAQNYKIENESIYLRYKREGLTEELRSLLVQKNRNEQDRERVKLQQAYRNMQDSSKAKADKKAEDAAKKEAQVQKSLAAEKLKQFDIDTRLSSIILDRQEQVKYELSRLSERTQLQKNIILLEEEDARLQQAKLKTLAQQETLRRDELKTTIDQLALEKELQSLRSSQETAGIGLGLRQELEGLQLPTGNIFEDERMALLTKQANRYVNTLADVNNDLAIQQKILDDPRSSADAQVSAEARIKALQDQKAIYEEMLPAIAAAEQQQLAYNQALSLVEGPVSSLMSGLRDVVAGTKSVEAAFADFLQSLADTLLQYATQMIATYIALGIARAFGLGASAAASSTPIPGSMPQMTEGAVQTTTGFEGMYSGMAANGGQVDKGETYIVGERGPEVFTATSNGSIIPGNVFAATRAAISNGTSSTNEAFAENSDAINTTNMITKERMLERERLAAMKNNPIDIRYESSVINSVEYVTAEQHRQGLAQAAERGRALTLQSLRNSPKTRKKVGV